MKEEATMRLRNLALGLASAVVLTACAQQQASDTSEAPTFDAETVRAQVDRFVSTWNAGDHVTLGTMIAEDAVLMQPDGPPLEGRGAVLETIAEGYDVAMFQQTATVDEVLAVGDHAYGRGTWTMNPTPDAGGDLEALNGKWSALYRPGPDGGWQIWRWMWNQPSGVALPGE